MKNLAAVPYAVELTPSSYTSWQLESAPFQLAIPQKLAATALLPFMNPLPAPQMPSSALNRLVELVTANFADVIWAELLNCQVAE